tara:strand:- start:387 stop:602 length:216 start_codon:yes stop_codon:yes gene_type:complete
MRQIECTLCKEKFDEVEVVKFGELEFRSVGGHSPEPLASKGRCCTKCNYNKVVIARALSMFNIKKENNGSN